MAWLKRVWAIASSRTAMAIIAFASVAFGIYQTFFYERRGEILTTASPFSKVYDVHQDIGGLDVSYGGLSLKESRKVLWSTTITMKNVGNAVLRRDDFDSQEPLLIKVEHAEIAAPPALSHSSPYLAKHLSHDVTQTEVKFAPTIWEAGETVTVSLVLLASEGELPELSTHGKIVGHQKAPVLRSSESTAPLEVPLWSAAFSSYSPVVQTARTLGYGVFFILFVLFIIGFLVTTTTWINRIRDVPRRRKRTAEALEFVAGLTDPVVRRLASTRYIEDGPSALYGLRLSLAVGPRGRPKLQHEQTIYLPHRIDAADAKALISLTPAQKRTAQSELDAVIEKYCPPQAKSDEASSPEIDSDNESTSATTAEGVLDDSGPPTATTESVEPANTETSPPRPQS